jgi:hypothetical protein
MIVLLLVAYATFLLTRGLWVEALVGSALFLLQGAVRVWWRKRHPPSVDVAPEKPALPPLDVPADFGRPRPVPDRLFIDGYAFEVLDGTVFAPGKTWVIRAKLSLGPGDTARVERLIREQAIVWATLERAGGDHVHGEAKVRRGSCFRDRERRYCASLELIGTGEIHHL